MQQVARITGNKACCTILQGQPSSDTPAAERIGSVAELGVKPGIISFPAYPASTQGQQQLGLFLGHQSGCISLWSIGERCGGLIQSERVQERSIYKLSVFNLVLYLDECGFTQLQVEEVLAAAATGRAVRHEVFQPFGVIWKDPTRAGDTDTCCVYFVESPGPNAPGIKLQLCFDRLPSSHACALVARSCVHQVQKVDKDFSNYAPVEGEELVMGEGAAAVASLVQHGVPQEVAKDVIQQCGDLQAIIKASNAAGGKWIVTDDEEEADAFSGAHIPPAQLPAAVPDHPFEAEVEVDAAPAAAAAFVHPPAAEARSQRPKREAATVARLKPTFVDPPGSEGEDDENRPAAPPGAADVRQHPAADLKRKVKGKAATSQWLVMYEEEADAFRGAHNPPAQLPAAVPDHLFEAKVEVEEEEEEEEEEAPAAAAALVHPLAAEAPRLRPKRKAAIVARNKRTFVDPPGSEEDENRPAAPPGAAGMKRLRVAHSCTNRPLAAQVQGAGAVPVGAAAHEEGANFAALHLLADAAELFGAADGYAELVGAAAKSIGAELIGRW